MRVKAFLIASTYILILFCAASLLTGCETGRALYHACKDGHCR
jgi:hypothetical protein